MTVLSTRPVRIHHEELSSDSFFDVQNISDAYDHLVLRSRFQYATTNATNPAYTCGIRVNGQILDNYRAILNLFISSGILNSGGDGVSSSWDLDAGPMGCMSRSDTTTRWGYIEAWFPYYTRFSVHKYCIINGNVGFGAIDVSGDGNYTPYGAAQCRITDPINRIQFGANIGSSAPLDILEAGSEMSLWGVRDR